MEQKQIISKSQDQTMQLGSRIAKLLKPGDIVCLFGDLGTGKTTLVKGVAEGLAIPPEKVHSPTFVLMNIYEGRMPLFHFDLYRIDHIRQIEMIGYEEFFYDGGLAVIEWAEKLEQITPKEYLEIKLEHEHEHSRLIKITGRGERYHRVVDKIS